MKFKLFPLLLLAASCNSFADSPMFSIQILASEAPDIETLKMSSGFDEIYTEKTGFGLTRVKVGSYNNRSEAERALDGVRGKGYSDAFITSYKGQGAIIPVPTPLSSNSSPLEHQKSPAWQRLTEEQRRNVVYLDGVLHVHEGDEFIPLSSL